MTLVIGVDGGGTSAKGVSLDRNGKEVARGASSGAVSLFSRATTPSSRE